MGLKIVGTELNYILEAGIRKEWGDEMASKLDFDSLRFYDSEDENGGYIDVGVDLEMRKSPKASDKEFLELQDEVEKVKNTIQSYKDFLAFKGIQFDKDWNKKPTRG